jgi:hypothetical protein
VRAVSTPSGSLDNLSLEQLQALRSQFAQSQGSSPPPPPSSSPVYQGQSAYAGQPGTPAQIAYQAANTRLYDANAPVGSPTNPSYDTPDNVGGANISHVGPDGRLASPGLDGMSLDQLQALRAQMAEPSMSGAEDMARTAPGALARGATDIGGSLGDMQNLGQRGFNWLADHALAGVQDFTGSDLGLPHHPHTPAPYQDIMNGGGLTSGDLNTAVQGLFGAYHQPQGVAGRAMDTVGQMAPGALFPGGRIARLARVLMPAAASETAGEVLRDPNNPNGTTEKVARLVGALGGGGAQAFGEGIANAPQIATSRFLDGYTPAQIADAVQFQGRQAATQGLSLTPLEALTQRSGGAANQLQHYVENSFLGKSQTQPFFDARRGQVGNAAQWAADLISPPTGQTPGTLGVQAQGEANDALAGVRQGINAAARPQYEALTGQDVPPEQYAQLASNPSYVRALADFRGQPEISAPYAHLPDSNLAVVNEVQKQIDANATAAAPGEFNPQGNHQLEAARTSASTLTGQVGRTASEPYGGQYGAARDTVAQGIADQLDPLRAGPLGAISNTPKVAAQTNALYPAQPNVGGVPELVAALQRLPQTAAPLTRQHILNTADKSLGDLQGGENQWAGAALAKALAGTDERAARLDAGVRTASGAMPADNLADLVEGLQATGKRLPAGSGTQFNAERAAALGVTPLPMRTLSGILDPLEIGQHLNKAMGGALYRRNIGSLSDLLTNMTPQEAQAFLTDAVSRGNMGSAGARAGQLLLNAGGAENHQ